MRFAKATNLNRKSGAGRRKIATGWIVAWAHPRAHRESCNEAHRKLCKPVAKGLLCMLT
jgi:hypothetical protein